MLKDYNQDILSVARKLPNSFSGSLDTLIEWSGMTEEKLAEASYISEKTIQRLRNNEPDNLKLETVIQLCIGMKLPPPLSRSLLRAARKDFMPTERHLVYQFLLDACYTRSLEACNQELIAQGFKPLGQ